MPLIEKLGFEELLKIGDVQRVVCYDRLEL